jgi:hypothetical protein
MIWASLLAALLKRSLTHFAEASLGVELSTQRAAASGKHYFDDVLRGLLDSPRQLRRALAKRSSSSTPTRAAPILLAIASADVDSRDDWTRFLLAGPETLGQIVKRHRLSRRVRDE